MTEQVSTGTDAQEMASSSKVHRLEVNGVERLVECPDDVPLLWVVREELGLPGTKFGCGMGACGACTVHLNGVAVRSCVTPVVAAVGAQVTTIEGIASGDQLHPLQDSWIKHNVPQCGYCQSGQIMAAASLLAQNPKPSSDEIKAQMSGNICRCGAYQDILRAIEDVVSGGSAQ